MSLDDGVGKALRGLADLHAERGSVYGDDYLRVGNSLAGMFPQGIELRTAEDFTRFALFVHMHGKMLRYAVNFDRGGHADSLDDLSVYSQLLRRTDE